MLKSQELVASSTSQSPSAGERAEEALNNTRRRCSCRRGCLNFGGEAHNRTDSNRSSVGEFYCANMKTRRRIKTQSEKISLASKASCSGDKSHGSDSLMGVKNKS